MTAQEDHAKLKELIIYISARYAFNPKYGLVKLNKILSYSDFEAYYRLGHSITREEHFKIQFGPAPKKIKPVIEEMKVSGEITEIVVPYHIGPQHRLAPKRDADLSLFTSDEISIVERYIQYFWNKDATQVKDISHELVGWKITKEKETIPYETIFLCHPEDIVISDLSREKAERLAGK